jgi:hypothetical protein
MLGSRGFALVSGLKGLATHSHRDVAITGRHAKNIYQQNADNPQLPAVPIGAQRESQHG